MPRPDPIVVRVMQEFKAGLLRREVAQLREMARRWLEVERGLQDRIDALAEEIARLRAAGQVVTRGQLYQMERYQALLAQVRIEVRQYEMWAAGRITLWQRQAGGLGVEQAREAIRAAGVREAFNLLAVSAVEYMAGLCADGAPLFDLLRSRALWPEAVDGLTRALVDSIAMGWNPHKTASRMADGLAQGLEKARVIARTEQLRVYRAATVEQYRESGVVQGFKRLCARDTRTCLACLAADGTVYTLASEMTDHPCGRCTCVPIVVGMPEAQWQTGAQWFRALDASAQREMMGDRLYELWDRGRGFDFRALARTTHSDIWGDGLRVATYEEMTRVARLRRAA